MWGTSSESESELVISPSKKDWDEGDECREHPVKVKVNHVISPSKKDWDEGDECGEHPVKVKVKVNLLSHHPRRIGTNEVSVGKILGKIISPSKKDRDEGDECGEHPGGRDHGEGGPGVHVVVVVERLHDGKIPVHGHGKNIGQKRIFQIILR